MVCGFDLSKSCLLKGFAGSSAKYLGQGEGGAWAGDPASPFSSREDTRDPVPAGGTSPAAQSQLLTSLALGGPRSLAQSSPCRNSVRVTDTSGPQGALSAVGGTCSRPSARNVPFPGKLSVPVRLAGCTAVSSRPRSLPWRGLDPRPPTLPSNRFCHAQTVGTPEKRLKAR